MDKAEWEALPYDVRRYVEQQCNSEIEGNLADHRPTSSTALENITVAAAAKWANYQTWLRSGTEEEQKTRQLKMQQCASVHEYFQKKQQGYSGYDTHYLTNQKLEGQWMLAPMCLRWWNDVTELRKIFGG